MSLFVSLELVTITSYVLAAFKRNDPRSTEAGLKYLVVGAVSSAILLFGVRPRLRRHRLGRLRPDLGPRRGEGLRARSSRSGTVLVFGGLFFKCSAVPFQVWAPDVYQGAPIAGDGVPLEPAQERGLRAPAARRAGPRRARGRHARAPTRGSRSSASSRRLTLLYGNLGAMAQKDVKRLLAYSSIGHAGYMLMGVTAVVAARDAGAAAGGRGGGPRLPARLLRHDDHRLRRGRRGLGAGPRATTRRSPTRGSPGARRSSRSPCSSRCSRSPACRRSRGSSASSSCSSRSWTPPQAHPGLVALGVVGRPERRPLPLLLPAADPRDVREGPGPRGARGRRPCASPPGTAWPSRSASSR